ncbi:MAG TPA: hypothetical protein DCG28_03330 [Lachnospiraceae bacterium]|nr:hypothetical protein [Lachnospiraceae bacterium]
MIIVKKNSEEPIYIQIYNQIKDQIEKGYIKTGERLYSTRALAQILGVSRNTVERAYEMLLQEDYLYVVRGSGYTVKEINPNYVYTKAMPKKPKVEKKKVKFDMINNFSEALLGDNDWRKCFTNAIDVLQSREIMDFSQRQGEDVLLDLIAKSLHMSRGVNCEPYRIVLTSGIHYSMEIIGGLFEKEVFTILVEEPSTNAAKRVFKRLGFNIEYIPVEDDGIKIDELYKYTNAVLFITPVHQFPTGSELSTAKRRAILDWATKNNGYIIEDDYDSALCYKAAPQAAIQAYDINDRVIFIGNYVYMLSPGMKVYYIVLPKHLYNMYDIFYNGYINQVPLICQYALVEHMSKGYMSRHQRRFLKNNFDKYVMLTNCLNDTFGDKIEIYGGGYGLFLNVRVKNGMDEDELIEKGLKNGVKVYGLRTYYKDASLCPGNSVRIGFGSVNLNDIPKAVGLLYKAWFGD